MFKLEIGKKYVCRNGQVLELLRSVHEGIGRIHTDDKYFWSFSLLETLDVHRLFFNREDEWDIVAEYVKKPRKSSSPYKKLLTAKDGDVFVLKGERFTVEELGLYNLSLTSLDRKNDRNYHWIHVRDQRQRVVFGRQELIHLLRSGKYTVY